MTMGSRINRARKDKGFTQEYVAESLGVTRQAVFKWEKDQTRPDTKNLIALSVLLGVSTEYLMKGQSIAAPARHYPGEGFFRASLIPLLMLPICWIIGLFSGAYTDMVQISVSAGLRVGIPFLMYGHSPGAIVLVTISILSLIAFFLLLYLGHHASKSQ